MKISKAELKRKAKYGGFATVITIIFIVAVLIVNMIATGLTDKFGLSVDLTEDNSFEIGSASKEYVKDIEDEVKIYVLYEEYNYKKLGKVYAQAASVIESYSYANQKITVQYKDIISDPTFVKQFEKLTLHSGDVVVQCGDKAKRIAPNDMFGVGTNGTTITESYVEREVTRAILNVTSGEMTKISVLTGFNNESAVGLIEELENNNYEVTEQSLVTEEIDSEAAAVILFAPRVDLTEDAIKKIEDFLDNDGELGKTLIYFMSDESTMEKLTNVDALLKDWGIETGYGFVYETNMSNILNATSAYAVSAQITNKEAAGSVANKNLLFASFNSRPLKLLFETEGSYKTETLVQLSKTVALYPEDAGEDYKPSEEDICGPLPAIALSTLTRYKGSDAVESKIMVGCTSAICDAGLLKQSSLANAEYMVGVMNYLTGTEEGVYIESKDLNTSYITTTAGQSKTVKVVFLYATPIAIMLGGLAVWLIRRHK